MRIKHTASGCGGKPAPDHTLLNADVRQSHRLMLEGDFSTTELGDVVRGEGVDAIRHDGGRRRLMSITLQDEYRPADALTLTAGVRYDHYDDIDDYTTSRFAAVGRLNPRAGTGVRRRHGGSPPGRRSNSR